jgi:hypothetical protein
MTHHCPVRPCARDDVPDHLFMCLPHWRMVPHVVQRAVNAAYDRGAGIGTPQLRAAHVAAVRAVNQQLGYPTPEET